MNIYDAIIGVSKRDRGLLAVLPIAVCSLCYFQLKDRQLRSQSTDEAKEIVPAKDEAKESASSNETKENVPAEVRHVLIPANCFLFELPHCMN